MLHLLLIAFALLCGLLMTRLMSRFRLPDVTAYLVAGVLIGPCCLGALGLGFTSFEQVEGMGLITDVALGFIAFAIGHEFRLSSLKKTGRQAVIIGILQAVITSLLVDIVLIGLHFLFPNVISVPCAIVLGAIASATAPAATQPDSSSRAIKNDARKAKIKAAHLEASLKESKARCAKLEEQIGAIVTTLGCKMVKVRTPRKQKKAE